MGASVHFAGPKEMDSQLERILAEYRRLTGIQDLNQSQMLRAIINYLDPNTPTSEKEPLIGLWYDWRNKTTTKQLDK